MFNTILIFFCSRRTSRWPTACCGCWWEKSWRTNHRTARRRASQSPCSPRTFSPLWSCSSSAKIPCSPQPTTVTSQRVWWTTSLSSDCARLLMWVCRMLFTLIISLISFVNCFYLKMYFNMYVKDTSYSIYILLNFCSCVIISEYNYNKWNTKNCFC